MLNSLNRELTVCSDIENADREEAPWNEIRKDIESVVLLDGISFICNHAFGGCCNLRSAQIPNSVKSIGERTFARCYYLDKITIPDSVETIGKSAFAHCNLISIKIPASVVSFGGNPFFECGYLNKINVEENPNFAFVNGVLMNSKQTQIIYNDPLKFGDYTTQIQ